MAQSLLAHKQDILNANLIDLEKAVVSDVMKDRLKLNDQRLNDMAQGILVVVKLSDPTGKILNERTLENGLVIQKVSVPLGVIGIIYESRPNVTADAFALCFKTGNTVILKGGSDAIHSNMAIVKSINETLSNNQLPEGVLSLIEDTSRETATAFMKMNEYVDVLIP